MELCQFMWTLDVNIPKNFFAEHMILKISQGQATEMLDRLWARITLLPTRAVHRIEARAANDPSIREVQSNRTENFQV